MKHYHVVSLTDPGHQSAGYDWFDQADEEATDRMEDTGDPHTVSECNHPDCERVTLPDHLAD